MKRKFELSVHRKCLRVFPAVSYKAREETMPHVLWFLHIPQQYRIHYWLYRNALSASTNCARASSEGLAHLLDESYRPSPCCPGKSTWKRSYNLWEQYKIWGSSKLSRNKTLTYLQGKATFKVNTMFIKAYLMECEEGATAQWQSSCLAHRRPWVQFQKCKRRDEGWWVPLCPLLNRLMEYYGKG